jgi:hypothetical protein
MKTTYFWNRYDPLAKVWALYSSVYRTVVIKRDMGSAIVIVISVRLEQTA